jgi:predicted flap endonuclease-1-like 5' DNA nuclease
MHMKEVKLGASGGDGGLPVEGYVIPASARISEVQVTSGWYVDSIRLIYTDAAGITQALPSFGGNSSHAHRFILEPGEYLVGVSGRSGHYVDNIVFHTNLRVSPAYGGAGGENTFAFLAPENSEVVGFFGRADWYVDAIGIVARALPVVAETPAPAAEASAPTPDAKPVKTKKTTRKSEVAPPPVVENARAVEVAATPAPDNLEIIEGIGPKIAGLLAQNGIDTFAALANASAEQLRALLLAAGRRFAVSDPTTWPDQAALAAKADMDALKAMQADLKGGRKIK